MNGLKQRIVGAIVLVSLAVIFIPMIFENPHHQESSQVMPVPEEPEVPAFTIELPVPPERTGKSQTETGSDSVAGITKEAPSRPVQTLTTVAEMEAGDTGKKAGDGNKKSVEKSNNEALAPNKSKQAEGGPTHERQISEKTGSEARGDKIRRPVIAAQGENQWSVQVGTFKNQEGALKLRDELENAGTPTYVQDVNSGDVTMLRIYAGPVSDKEQAKKLKQSLDKRYNVQSLVVRFKP